MTKKNSKLTKIKERFGTFEVRISDDKVEIEDYINRQRKFVYSNATYEYGLFRYILSEGRMVDGKYEKWTPSEEKSNRDFAHYLVGMLSATQMLFTFPELRNDFMKLISDIMDKQIPEESDETEEEILANLKAEHEAKELLKEEGDDEEIF